MQLSNSALSVFKNCPRCFWLDRNGKIARPRGIFSSLPNGIDKLLKEKMQQFRGSLPPELAACPELEGFELYAGDDLKKMQNWKTNPLKMQDAKGNVLVGALDDLLLNQKSQEFAILDFKTKGSPPDQGYCEKYYQTQVDIYTRFFELAGKKVAPFAVLYYFWPIKSDTGLLDFKSKAFFLKTNTANADKLFADAIGCLEGRMPEASDDCEYCKYELQKKEFLETKGV